MIHDSNKCSTIAEMGYRLATIDVGIKLGAVPLWGKLRPHQTQCVLAEAYLHTKWHLDPSTHLATTDILLAENWGAVPLLGGELGPHLTQGGQCQGLPPCQVSS